FAIDGVDLEFEDSALRAVASKAIALNTGARGLRAILEDTLLDLMFEIPSDKHIEKVIVTKEAIEKSKEPVVIKKSLADDVDQIA
ncbi:MAG: ATP-dependent Clp protease ATP-binding subunit ClpX, partial [Clostridia bacterium]|nr:ATP-dependent Clp protease ATP-binding subunit ClpX [Clostridia bacterium]